MSGKALQDCSAPAGAGGTLADFAGDIVLLLNVMPVAMFVIDRSGFVVLANDRLIDLIGVPHEDFVGRSALDFIDPSDVDDALGMLGDGEHFRGALMGPTRIRYVDAAGERHYTQFWAYETPPDLGVDGYIITLTAESVRDVLATAMSAVASDEPLDRTLGAIASAGRAAPLDGIGTVLVAEPTSATDEERFRLIGDWPLSNELINAFATPWRRCLVQGTAQDVIDSGSGAVDARTGAEMAMAGLPAAWVRPVFASDGDVVAVFIVWRFTTAPVSGNQEVHIGESVRLAHLALEQAYHRRELEYAAHRDALTGVGNRASLNDRISLERAHPDVLFIDLDHFKTVNDTFGHDVGDEVIAQVGRRISEAVRHSDAVYRTGGDEFIVVCDRQANRPNDLLRLADRIVERITAPFDCREHRVRIGASVGIAGGEDARGEPRSLQKAIVVADRAMYVAKERGGGCVHHADVVR
ncbi:MAG: sensor domain-containing diguanylate cyclase [Ilumatobacter sp.]|nr:sensor domain-containing diguanylate cyclase [Ilumatobacter sp.]